LINVTKRDGQQEPLELNKLHKVTYWACEGLTGVSPSSIEINANLQLYDGIKTYDIQETLIKSAADLITEDTPNYQYVAGNLINYHLRKQVWGEYTPGNFYSHINKLVEMGYYDELILNSYSIDEIDTLGEYIDHDRDYTLTYAAMEQMRGKYLVQNRATKQIFETPQVAFMLISMTFFHRYKENRMQFVKDFYDAISQFDISLPTPIMAGMRTPQRQFSSCVLIDSDDSLESINATASAIVQYVSKKAGIGVNVGRIRAVGSVVRSGDVVHTGIIPFLKYFQAAVKSCSQGGVRGGAATFNFPVWHYEAEDLLVLKNNKGTEDTRVRHVDYCVQFNQLMYERLITGENITLFSPSDVPGLYEAFFTNNNVFKLLYETAEQNPSIRKKTVSALELFSSFIRERKDTGRMYLMNVDHVNTHSAFDVKVAPVYMANLCVEVNLPTVPMEVDNIDTMSEIALCTLGAVNFGKIKTTQDFEKPCDLIVRALNELLDFQEYPLYAAENAALNRRPLGIGVVNLAYWLAKNNMSYQHIDGTGLQKIHEYFEAWSYYLIKSSVQIAKESGQCDLNHETKYGAGFFPIDTYRNTVDELVVPTYLCDWESLRVELVEHGIKNSTLMCIMPSETSSQISNATNGIEPPRSLVSMKKSKDGVLTQVVPEIRRLKNKYDLLWDQKSPEGYLKICAVIQKFVDQSISVNTSYNPKFYPDEEVPMSVMMNDMLMFYRYGGKCLYYCNTNDQSGEIDVHLEIPEQVDDEECESCVI